MSLPKNPKRWKIGIIGAGSVGIQIALALKNAGFTVGAVVSRRNSGARALARQIQCRRSGTNLNLLQDCHWIIVCVPDPELSKIGKALGSVNFDDSPVLLSHTSGLLPANVFGALPRSIFTFSMHPLQTFPKTPKKARDLISGIWFALEGSPKALRLVKPVFTAIGANFRVIHVSVKPLYHSMAVFASNFVIGNLYAVEQLCKKMGLTRDQAYRTILPIFAQSVTNSLMFGTDRAITGPAIRGDQMTINAHRQAIKKDVPGLLPLYDEFTNLIRGMKKGSL